MKGLYLRGKVWYIDYYCDGKRIKKSVSKDRKIAEAVLQKRKLEVIEGKHLDIRRIPKVRFEDFAEEYLHLHSKLKRSYNTDFIIVKSLNKHFAGRYLSEITVLDIEKFKALRAREVMPATTNRELAVLRSMLNRAIEWGKLQHNPCKAVKLFKTNNQRLRFLEREEIDRLLSNCAEHLRPMVLLALNTGMRKGEILNLKWHDVDFSRDIIYLYETKNGERREIPMNSLVKSTLIKVRKHPQSAYIFCNRKGQPYGNIRKSLFTALRNAEISDFHFHDLRHTFASQLVMSGVDLNTVRELLGHKSLQMTLRYSHLSPSHKKRAVDILGTRISPTITKNGYNLVTGSKNTTPTEKATPDNLLSFNKIETQGR